MSESGFSVPMIDAGWPWQPSDLRMYSGLPSKWSVVLLTSSVAVPSVDGSLHQATLREDALDPGDLACRQATRRS